MVGRDDIVARMHEAIEDDGCVGIVLHGPPGVGKTRLATECAAIGERCGYETALAVASSASRSIALSAFAHLLPDDATTEGRGFVDPSTLLLRMTNALRQRAEGARLMLLVDDAHLLDGASAHLLHQLAATKAVFVVATVRSGEPVSDAVQALWKDLPVARLDLAALDAVGTELACASMLGVPVESLLARRIYEVSLGNPLYVRELLQGAADANSIAVVDGVARLNGELRASNALTELVEARVRSLDRVARSALELLAAAEPVGLDLLTEVVGAEALEHLDQAGLIRFVADRRRVELRLAHPLYGEVFKTVTVGLRGRTLRLKLADVTTGLGARRREDATRIARWNLESGNRPDPLVLLHAARAADYAWDHAQAERLASTALDYLNDDAKPDVQLQAALRAVLGSAQLHSGRIANALESLRFAIETTDDDRVRARAALTTTPVIFEGHDDLDRAVEVIDEAMARVSDARWHDELLLQRTTALVEAGRIRSAWGALSHIVHYDEPSLVSRSKLIAAPVQLALGNVDQALQSADDGFTAQQTGSDDNAVYHPAAHRLNTIYALIEAGRLSEAQAVADVLYDLVLEERRPVGIAVLLGLMGRIALRRGQPVTARGLAAKALRAAQPLNGWYEAGATAVAACSALLLGDSVANVELPPEPKSMRGVAFLYSERLCAHGWAKAALGDREGAIAWFGHAAELARDEWTVVLEASCYYEMARLGSVRGDDVERVVGFAERTESAVIAAQSCYVLGLAERDALKVFESAKQFAEIEMMFAAGEAAMTAADLARRSNEPRTATAYERNAQLWLALCEGARTSVVIAASASVPLTNRERDIAVLAVEGLTSREIGARLFLSFRTVENHLQRIYTKLGVTGRAELVVALASD